MPNLKRLSFSHIQTRRPAFALIAVGAILHFGFLLSPAFGQKPLRWKFQPQQRFQVELQQQVESETSIARKPVKIVVDLTMDLTWEVTSVSADAVPIASMKQTIDRIRLKLTVPAGGMIDYDSAAKKSPPDLAATVGELIGAHFVMHLDALGHITDVELPEETESRLKKAATVPGQTLFSKDQFERLVRQSAVILPENEVSPGTSWENRLNIEGPFGTLVVRNTYTYDGNESRDGKLLEKITLSSKLDPGDDNASRRIVVKDHSQLGILYFDAQEGQMTESNVSQRIKAETRLREMVIESNLTSTLKMKLTPIP